MRRKGRGVIAIDIGLGAHCDVLNDHVFDMLKGWITSYTVEGMLVATPCGSFSRARRAPAWSRFPHAVRSTERPRGLPGLTGADRRTVQRGNAIADRSFALIELARSRLIPGLEENPRNSFLHILRNRLKFAQGPQVVDHCVDMCAFGTPYRKSTRLRTWCCKKADLSGYTCSGSKVCKFSGLKHLVLSGCADKQFVTHAAQEYPPKFCTRIAQMLCNAIVGRRASNLWDHIY